MAKAQRTRPVRVSRTATGSRSRPPKGYWFDAREAASAVAFIEARCRHWQGAYAGRPFYLSPYQRRTTEDIVGWKRADGAPRFRCVYVEVPKGNGKTPWGAALVLLALHWSGETGAEVYSVAGDREQARLVYADARGMTLESPELTSRSVLYTHSIKVPSCNAVYKVLSAEAHTKHGPRPYRVIFDELHVQPNRKLFDILKSGVEKRDDSQLIMLTTAGGFDQESLCYTEHEYARATTLTKRDPGHIADPSYYAVIYAAHPDDDPGDEKVWAEVNPNLNVSVSLQGMRDAYRRAKHNPVELATFKQLRLNIWGDDAEGVINSEHWKKCSGKPICRGRCYIGMDLSSKIDLTAVAAYFPETHSVLVHFWIPAGNLEERGRRDVFDYRRYVSAGLITATDGTWVDQTSVRAHVNELREQHDVREIGFDSWNASEICRWLEDEDGFTITEVRQGSRTLSEPFKYLVSLVDAGELRHGGHPVLTWNARNLKARRDGNQGWSPDKRSQRKRIDGMSAAIMAVERAMGSEGESVYESDDWTPRFLCG